MVFIICITSYYHSSLSDNGQTNIKDNSLPLRVNCAGHYRLVKLKYLETTRPNGRLDYQLLYIAQGSAHFRLSGKYQEIPAGNIMVYRPGQKQFYYYLLEDQADIYWIHFTGYQSEHILEQFHLSVGTPQYIGLSSSLQSLFNSIIHESQLRRPNYADISALMLQQLFYLIGRTQEEGKNRFSFRHEAIASAMLYMHENYQKHILVKDLAVKYHMTYNWFIRCFVDFTGRSPQAYLTDIRIEKAKELLTLPSLRISEVAELIGYSDPLYFSRIFKKKTGQSPREFKQ